MDTEERRRRLATRHRLTPGTRVDDVAEVARSMIALHATDPASVYLQVQARSDLDVAAVEQALYVDRTVVKLMGMRRTLFVPPREAVAVVQHATMDRVGAEQRRVLIRDLVLLATLDGDTEGRRGGVARRGLRRHGRGARRSRWCRHAGPAGGC